MARLSRYLRFGVTLLLVFVAGVAAAQAQEEGKGERAGAAGRGYSDSTSATRPRTSRLDEERSPARILREARTIFVEPNKHIDAKYLEYKLGKYAELQQWGLSIVKDRRKADLVLGVHRTALNYIFSVEEPASSVVVANGKVVAINGLVAAEDIAREIIRRMKNTRALPAPE
ncbi:MAG: hypothetical protein ACRD68_00775 [Pyrinomonadaceae bacterium]